MAFTPPPVHPFHGLSPHPHALQRLPEEGGQQTPSQLASSRARRSPRKATRHLPSFQVRREMSGRGGDRAGLQQGPVERDGARVPPNEL